MTRRQTFDFVNRTRWTVHGVDHQFKPGTFDVRVCDRWPEAPRLMPEAMYRHGVIDVDPQSADVTATFPLPMTGVMILEETEGSLPEKG
jgi:hypothetical protein